MENIENNPNEGPGFLGGFGFIIIIVLGVIAVLVGAKLMFNL